MKNIAIIYGGYSSEIIVSEKSKEGVMTFIDETKYKRYPILITNEKWCTIIDEEEYPVDKNDFSFMVNGNKIAIDFAYITIHGTPGEDGLLQGYFKMLNIPHSTCDTQAASISFNKFTCNTYLKGFGVAVADSVLVRKGHSFNGNDIIEQLGLPCFVKPNAGGSSFGITKVKESSEITPAIEKAFTESDEVIIEQFVAGTEVTCGLYKTSKKQEVFPVTEVVSKNDFFDFEAKYTASKVEEITPARIEDKVRDRIQSISSLIYDILGCKGIVRIDYIISDNKIFLLEVNTTPGMTVTSFIPQQIEAAGLDIKEVFSEIIENEMS
ncbi:D-alanine--D-alanine ligase [Carboxylicivirga marina]|uniref:D-alanine--D-alanine ligase n=1 Tax=Carboxylicivirga marina TaxID=2800988 RepID=UPI002592D1A0|nr:D-alanine--D-alanine ligase [uncultured Carboxylicivirga sp.]